MPNIKGEAGKRKFMGFFGDECYFNVKPPLGSEKNENQRSQYETAKLIKERFKDRLSDIVSLTDIVDFIYCVRQSPKMDYSTEELIEILNKRVGHHPEKRERRVQAHA